MQVVTFYVVRLESVCRMSFAAALNLLLLVPPVAGPVVTPCLYREARLLKAVDTSKVAISRHLLS